MTKRQLLLNAISFSMLPITVFSVIDHPAPRTNLIAYFNITTFWWIVIVLIFVAFLLNSYYYLEKGNSQNMRVIQWYLVWNLFCIVRGGFVSETYWDWKGLIGNSFGLLAPLVAYSALNTKLLQSILTTYLKYVLPLFLVFFFIINTDSYGFYLVPIGFLMLFFPVLSVRWKWIIAIFSVLVMSADLGARSNVIKFGVPSVLMLLYYLRYRISTKLLEVIRLILIIIPVILFSLAVSGLFNVFEIDKYVKKDYNTVERDANGNIVEDDLKADTRTFLYVEVLYSAKVYNSWIIGRSPARGNLSEAFGYGEDKGGRVGERLGNEVAILNVFTWTGIVGVILYLFVFYRASYLAINQSNNIFSKIIGLFIAFRWAYAWVEDINYFTLTTVFLWLTIGFCFSRSFRSMSDKEVQRWVRGIFRFQNGLTKRELQRIKMKRIAENNQ